MLSKQFPRTRRIWLVILMLPTVPIAAQIVRVTDLTTEQLDALDRKKTVVLMPGGILEQHGPHLPAFTDGYLNEWLTQQLAAGIARPGWTALIFPTIPLGAGGANEIGRKYVFPGTYAVRSATLRAVFMDLATELGEQGFQWIFIVHGHGAPNHNRSLDEASDYFRDRFGGHMVHLLGLMPVFTSDVWLGDDARRENGFSVHAGAEETARLLAIHPALVNPGYAGATPATGRDWKELVQIARAPGWAGYFGSPRLARAEDGSRANQSLARAATAYALKILDGLDERTIPRYGSIMRDSPYNVSIDRDALERDKQMERAQQAWLKRRGVR